jgi:hypothetical protein
VSIKAVISKLIADAGVQALAGDQAEGGATVVRVYPNRAPQGVDRPFIVVRRISGAPVITYNAGPTTLGGRQVQVDSYADSYAGADGLALAVMAALNGYAGTVASIDVRGVLLQDVSDDYEPPVHADEAGIHRVSLDFLIWNRTEG